jgi:O-antigen ligase
VVSITRTPDARATDWWRPVPPASADAVSAPAVGLGADDRRDRLAFRAILVYTAILLLAPQSWIPALQPLRIALLTAGFAVATYVGGRLARGRPLSIMPREMWLALALVAWAIITLPFSLHPGASLATLIDLWGKALIVFWLLVNTAASLPRLRRVAWALTLMAVPPALSAIHHYVSGTLSGSGGVKRIPGYEAPLTSNPNDLALMMNLTLPFTVMLLSRSRRASARAALLTVIALQVTAIVLTFSRGGFLTLAVTVIALVWRYARRGRTGWAAAIVAVALVGLALLPGSYVERLRTIDDIDRDTTGSAQARWNMSVRAVQYISAHPIIGAGLGNDILGMNETEGPRWLEVHNVYLQIGMELGLPGLALYVALLLGCIAAARRAERAAARVPGGRDLSAFAAAAKLTLVVFSVAAMFHPVAYHGYFYYFAALALAARAATPMVRA